MQFIRNVPDLSEHLLQAHEDGRVVFFCGARTSCPVLPNYAGLVNRLYTEFGVTPNPSQERTIGVGQYDITVNLLEAKIVNDRTKVRQTPENILKEGRKPNKNTTHEYLLTLSKNREDDSTRLVTINFDRLFEKVITDKSPQVKRFQAPLSPIPKRRWD